MCPQSKSDRHARRQAGKVLEKGGLMISRWVARLCVAALVGVFVLIPDATSAQQASGIAGVVRDASAAVLPGVTVEAASPALIERVRTVVTDGEGRYNIVDLRPGTYVVTFSLGGFNTVRREGIELRAGFTATVNADMQVGSLQETITVTGASPLVDTQNVRLQAAVSSELRSALPTGSQGLIGVATLVPGMTSSGLDAGGGGATGIYGANQTTSANFHGKAGSKQSYDGMQTNRSEEHTSELQSLTNLVCRLLLEKKKNQYKYA